MEERYPIYADADITVDSGDGPHEIVVDKIITALAALEGPPSPLDEATNK